jgi:uncharacterized protein HemY
MKKHLFLFMACLIQSMACHPNQSTSDCAQKIESLEARIKVIDIRLQALLAIMRYKFVCETINSLDKSKQIHYFGGGDKEADAKKDVLTQCWNDNRSEEALKLCQSKMHCEKGRG